MSETEVPVASVFEGRRCLTVYLNKLAGRIKKLDEPHVVTYGTLHNLCLFIDSCGRSPDVFLQQQDGMLLLLQLLLQGGDLLLLLLQLLLQPVVALLQGLAESLQ